MNIRLQSPLFLNEKGKRDNNEDCIFPLPRKASGKNSLFIVCDGVGGVDKGEVASNLACISFADYFKENIPGESTEQDILSAFAYVQQKFDEHIANDPGSRGFGTTLVLLHIHSEGLTVAHCGDSRFYQIRGNNILFETVDHTPVNDLVRSGIITPEEAALQPKTSRISRAIQGNSVQRTKPDVTLISDIQIDDYFILCSDGVYGCMTNTDLVDIIASDKSEIDKLGEIQTRCEADSHDNFSIYLLKVSTLNATDSGNSESGFLNSLKNLFKKTKD